MNKKIATRIAVITIFFPIAVVVLALVVIANFDWNKTKPWINEHVSEALGRPFAIAGDLSLAWEEQSSAQPGQQRNWRDLIPWPHLTAHDIRIGNDASLTNAGPMEAGMSAQVAENMAHVDRFNFSLNPLALLEKKIEVPLMRFDTPVVYLLRRADGKNNWTFKNDDNPSQWHLELQRIVFSKGSIHLIDAVKHADVTADIDTINADPNYGVAWQLHGKFNNEPINGSGKSGAVLGLQHQMTPYPVEANIRIGTTAIAVEGTITKPLDLAAIDARLKLSGQSMEKLYAISGILLPNTPPFSTEGHLIGTLGKHSAHWVYENFQGKVGGSDLDGTLDYQSKPVRPLLSGKVRSHLMQFVDLAPLIGADSNASKARRGETSVQPDNKALPVEPFKTDRWTSIDAEVTLNADKVIWKNAPPISKLTTNLQLRDGVLNLLPLNFLIAGGNLNTNITLDGSGRSGVNAIKAAMNVSARNVKVQQLFPAVQGLPASVGEINGDAALSAVGNSVASLLGQSDGEIKTFMVSGTVSKLILEEMGLNIGSIITTSLFGDKQVNIDCLAADFAVRKGIAQTHSFIIDSDTAIIEVSGNIDMQQEQIDMTVKSKSKGLRFMSLRAPIYVRGSFMQPHANVDKGVVAMKTVGAIALTALTPIAALIPVTNVGAGKGSDCPALLAQARVKPVLPSVGRTH